MVSHLDDVNSIEQTSAYLKIEESQLRRLVHAQKIGCLRSGRTLTFPRAAIEAYVEKYQTAALPGNPNGLTDASWRRVSGAGQ
jgi:excisionase family DNA binding protein